MPVSRLPSGSLFQFTPLREGRPMSSVINCSRYVISIHAPPRGATARMNTALLRRNISIHAPPRGATIGQRICLLQEAFQFTPLREGRPLGSFASILQRYFNSRPSARGDGRACTVGYTNGDFNSRPSARGDQQGFCGALACCDYFNSRPSARGDHVLRQVATCHDVFQFTPLREGRRVSALAEKAALEISIHAPPRGATISKINLATWTLFQFTPLREGRLSSQNTATFATCISIHAPPRGATSAIDLTPEQGFISIHAPPRGATSVVKFAEALGVFQFTPLREGRHADGKQESQATYFNSRPSARGDMPTGSRNRKQLISIHAPPRGATNRTGKSKSVMQYFNSRPSARGDWTHYLLSTVYNNFNSRPSARGDPWLSISRSCEDISIHAPPRGATIVAQQI